MLIIVQCLAAHLINFVARRYPKNIFGTYLKDVSKRRYFVAQFGAISLFFTQQSKLIWDECANQESEKRIQ